MPRGPSPPRAACPLPCRRPIFGASRPGPPLDAERIHLSYGLLLGLRTVHVLGGAFWFGAALMNVFFLVPTARALGPGGGAFIGHVIGVRRLPRWVNIAAWTTILSGAWLYGWRSSWFSSPWMGTGEGLLFGIGGIAALAAALLGALLIGPTAKRLGALAAGLTPGAPPPPETAAEMERLQGRMQVASLTGVSLIVLATVCMAVGRYH